MSIDHWLFAPVDPRIARIFRVLLVLTMLPVFWPNERPLLGVIARRPELALLWSQVFLTPGWAAIALPALAAFGLGWGGRAMGWLAAALLLPLVFVPAMQSRQVLWLALLVLSLLHSGRSRSPGPGTAAGPLWPVRLLQLQLSTLYAANAWGKLTPEYLSGDVLVGLSRRLSNFRVDLSDGRLHLEELLFEGALPFDATVPVWLCAVGTVAVESALAVGLWIPKLRIATVVLGLGFHGTLLRVIQIGWLDWASVFLYLAFLLPWERRDSARPEGVRCTPSAAPGSAS